MMRLGTRGENTLKLIHLIFTALWIGGVAALWPVASGVDATNPEAAREAYLNLRTIAWNVVGWGGVGSLFTGFALGLLTRWGVFRRGWTIAKLGLTVFAIALGMFFIENQMLAGLALLDNPSLSGGGADFVRHHTAFRQGLAAQLLVFLAIAALAVFKPRLGLRRREPQLEQRPGIA